MKQSEITLGVYESRDGMVRTVVEIHHNVLRDGKPVNVVRYRHSIALGAPVLETSLKTFAAWAARRRLQANPPTRPYAGDVIGGSEVQADWHVVREAEASCALDGETQCMASVDGAELEALRTIARAVNEWTGCPHGDICQELEPATDALGALEKMGCAWLTEGVHA